MIGGETCHLNLSYVETELFVLFSKLRDSPKISKVIIKKTYFLNFVHLSNNINFAFHMKPISI